jgi:hypothetical protein
MSRELYTRSVTTWWVGALDAADKIGSAFSALINHLLSR